MIPRNGYITHGIFDHPIACNCDKNRVNYFTADEKKGTNFKIYAELFKCYKFYR